jgi:phytoene dehydrogenase-like protein
MILIVGAGLAGLVAAKTLQAAGEDYLLVDAADAPGGRVRTDVIDGFRLDRGFQVLLDSYPAARQHLDIPALRPRYFDSGALLHDDGDFFRVLHPIRHPSGALAAALDPTFPFPDKLHLAALLASTVLHSDDSLLNRCANPNEPSTAGLLARLGFSPTFIRRFVQPFFGGVFLDNDLETSAGLFCYYLKKFATGLALIPARGIGEIPRQLAEDLPASRLRLSTRIDRLETSGTRATAAITAEGETLRADAILLATDEPATHRILGLIPSAARPARGVTAVYFRSSRPLYTGPLLVLPSGPDRLVRHLVQLTNVAPELAPDGQHLVSATILDPRGLDAAALASAAATEIETIFTEAREALTHLHTAHVPYAQPRQPPGFAAHLPNPTTPANVLLAGDQIHPCSIQSAMTSGESAAQKIATL